MPLLRLDKVSLAYGLRPLLHLATFELRRGERACLVGRNGEGKSSLLKLLLREINADSGEVWVRPGIRIAHLAQEVALDSDERVFDRIAAGLPSVGRALVEYRHVTHELEHGATDDAMRRLATLQQEIENADGWQLEQRVETVMSRLGLDGEAQMNALSGGWRRRVLLAQALVSEPDVLLLDEPTNHLDVEAIEWLEEFMLEFRGALLFVSHDRAFVRRLATRVLDLDRGQLRSWPGSYDTFLSLKAAALEAEAREAALFDKKLAEEEVWIRKGVEARRTRNEGRVRALYALREQRRARLDRVGSVSLELQTVDQGGKLVFEARDVTLAFEAQTIIRGFSARIMRGDRIGIIGPNGAGKTTLIRLLLGELEPDSGSVTRGTRLQVAYFDQQRNQLAADRTLMENVTGGGDTVFINGRARHVSSYLRDFLFPPERLNAPISMLSGGERNRLLLARLFAQPANVLVLDEPTNDLDIETLDLLEELIAGFDGTLLLVSHDRAFLDNVVTSTLVFEGQGRVREFVGGYSDWVRQRHTVSSAKAVPRAAEVPAAKAQPAAAAPVAPPAPRARRLSYKDQRELETLPARIESLEQQQAQLTAQIATPTFYQGDRDQVAATLTGLEAVTKELTACYARWESLEAAGQEG